MHSRPLKREKLEGNGKRKSPESTWAQRGNKEGKSKSKSSFPKKQPAKGKELDAHRSAVRVSRLACVRARKVCITELKIKGKECE